MLTTNKISEEQYRAIVRSKPISADEWNNRFQVGMAVTLVMDDRSTLETKTRSEAWELDNGLPVVAVEGKAGGYLLTRVLPKHSAQLEPPIIASPGP